MNRPIDVQHGDDADLAGKAGRAGGTTELLGAYNYISATAANHVPADAVPYIITDSTAALTFLTDNFRDNDYAVYIRDTQGATVREIKPADLAPRDGSPHDHSFVVPLYRTPSVPASR